MENLEYLQDIVNQFYINSTEFLISYPNYHPLKPSDDAIAKLQQLPQNIQNDYLSSLITDLIFSIYHNDKFIIETNEIIPLKSKDQVLLKNISSEVDWEFFQQLQNNNPGKGWWNPGARVIRQEADGSLALDKKGLTIHVKPEDHLRLEDQSAVEGDWVSVFTPSYQIVNQFYAAFGDNVQYFRNWVYIYFNFSSKGAVALMKEITIKFNELSINFIFHVLHNPINYGRYDAGMLRFDKDDYLSIREVLKNVYVENAIHFEPQVPLFTKMLAPGLGLAEKPEENFKYLDGFGMNRCKILAKALLEAHLNKDDSPEARMKYIIKHFENAGIDLERPYINPGSEDIYTPLDIINLSENLTV
ncbi:MULTISPECIES: T3SS effector HopA1 family protein [unclassified Moorena]|uniref:T3SS effector HopA1 family protein n=1 Tax=unclassified Moorena TaxID=2683338 RepID=UPI001401B110|nr:MULTISPECIES: T3SS effector HopA1 family protein [unclassified Moorena]NEO12817.1 hypothetical protein [Moorena sp. SIO3E8]NEP99592.1 hypothetical protein [Moorena sp. SIO3F7]